MTNKPITSHYQSDINNDPNAVLLLLHNTHQHTQVPVSKTDSTMQWLHQCNVTDGRCDTEGLKRICLKMRANKVMDDIINICRHPVENGEGQIISEESQQMTKMLECQQFLLTWPTKSLNNVLLLKHLNSRIELIEYFFMKEIEMKIC